MVTYNIKVTDRLLRFDTTNDSVTVVMLPFIQTPNAPYEIQRTSSGDGNTVTIETTGSDFLLADGSTSITLDDSAETVYIKIPAGGVSPAYVSWGSGGGGTGGGGGTVIQPAPPVTITPPAEVLPRDDGKVEIDVEWAPAASATSTNFTGAAVYLEDPDISSGAQAPLDGSTPLDGSAQVSGAWQPTPQGKSTKSPAVVIVNKQAGARTVRIYLAAYGPYTQDKLVRANQTGATPNITATVPGLTSGQSGQEYAFLVTNPVVNVVTDYNRPDPNYYLTFSYTPPDPATPIPANQQPFGGVRIVFVPLDSSGNPELGVAVPGLTDTGLDVPVKWAAGFKDPIYNPAAPTAGTQFRCYFCSEDTLGDINSLVVGVTPYATAIIPPLTPAPDVTNFQITNQQTVWLLDGSFVNQATLSWDIQSSAQYAGIDLYLVNVTGSVTPLTKFPQLLETQLPAIETSYVIQIPNGGGAVIPANDETWTIAAISVSAQGNLSDDPAKFKPGDLSPPSVTWIVGPPQPGSAGSGQEHAPLVTINPGASVTATETTSADGVRMVSFAVGSWTDPTSNQFGGAQVAMVVNHNVTQPTYWDAKNATSFTTPAMPAMGVPGSQIAVNFYIVSYDPQGNQNQLIQGTTPEIPYNYTPTSGAIIPARSGWFDPKQFDWTNNPVLTAVSFAANIINVGSELVVGGAPSGSNQTQFGNAQNGQIAVLDSSSNLVGWMGMQQPVQGNGAPLYGAWFKQLWVGGTSPLSAPLFVDNQGIIEVGGIAAQQGSQFPYISVRDQYGVEQGRIGAQISAHSGGSGDNTGPNPPQLTAGAWFTQLAIGGSNLSNWNILITPSSSNPLGSNFQMRNIALLSIDYPTNSAPSGYFNNEYRFDVGNSVWMAAGLPSGTYVFPGIHIYEVDNSGNNFGATFIHRGMVLRGTQSQNYQVLVSLVQYNGNASGQDSPYFYGELTMFCPTAATTVTIDLAAGSPGVAPGNSANNPYFTMFDLNGNRKFWVDIAGNTFQVAGVLQGINGQPIEANQYAIYGYNGAAGNVVIDSAGNWKGQPITGAGGQTPWTQNINANGFSLSGAGAISANSLSASQITASSGATLNGSVTVGALYQSSYGVVINTYGQFVGPGVNVGANGIACYSISCYYGASQTGEVACNIVTCYGNATFHAGLSVAGTLSLNALSVSGGLSVSGAISQGGVQCIANGIYGGNGVQTSSAIYGGIFGISGQGNGQTLDINIGGTTLHFKGGLFYGIN